MHLFWVLVLTFVVSINGKLIYLAELFRHGARYPVNNVYDGKTYKDMHGVLTSIGMRQQYNLGSYLRKDYL
jgi:lysosomal acid phosphatase